MQPAAFHFQCGWRSHHFVVRRQQQTFSSAVEPFFRAGRRKHSIRMPQYHLLCRQTLRVRALSLQGLQKGNRQNTERTHPSVFNRPNQERPADYRDDPPADCRPVRLPGPVGFRTVLQASGGDVTFGIPEEVSVMREGAMVTLVFYPACKLYMAGFFVLLNRQIFYFCIPIPIEHFK